jgi:hypothetical protein
MILTLLPLMHRGTGLPRDHDLTVSGCAAGLEIFYVGCAVLHKRRAPATSTAAADAASTRRAGAAATPAVVTAAATATTAGPALYVAAAEATVANSARVTGNARWESRSVTTWAAGAACDLSASEPTKAAGISGVTAAAGSADFTAARPAMAAAVENSADAGTTTAARDDHAIL